MKNKLLVLGIISLCLTGCNDSPKINKSAKLDKTNLNEKKEEPKPDADTPQWWLDMFTCNNVTIKNTHKTMGTEIIYYKYVEGMLYRKGPSDVSFIIYFEPTFDMLLEYRNSYQTFKIQEHESTCSCSDWKKYKGNAWIYSANLYFSDDKLYKIEESSTLSNLTYGDIYEFSDWGEATI